jgi:hypothetical protein
VLVGQGHRCLPAASPSVLDHRPADKTVAAAITAVEEATWVDIDSPDGGIAPVAETPLGEDRLIVRRSRLVGSQASLWPDWRYYGFVTDRAGSAVELSADHRRHAVGELAIRDLKDGAGCRHCPRGGSWPTPPGWSWARSRTTCCAGRPLPPIGCAPACPEFPLPARCRRRQHPMGTRRSAPKPPGTPTTNLDSLHNAYPGSNQERRWIQAKLAPA